MTENLGIALQSAFQQDGPNKASPDEQQEVDKGDFQPNKISLKLLNLEGGYISNRYVPEGSSGWILNV